MNVFIITTKMRLEFSNENYTNWNESKRNLFGFETLEEAQNEIAEMRKSEVKEYSEWLHSKQEKCFIHHYYGIESIPIFKNYD